MTSTSLNRPYVSSSMITRTTISTTQLGATDNMEGKRKRRRKSPPGAPTKDPIKVSQEKIDGLKDDTIKQGIENDNDDDDVELKTRKDLSMLNEIARFEFQKDKELSMAIQDDYTSETTSTSGSSDDKPLSIPLPDITEVRKRKQMEEEMKQLEKEAEETKVRIKRTDKVAMRKVRTKQPPGGWALVQTL